MFQLLQKINIHVNNGMLDGHKNVFSVHFGTDKFNRIWMRLGLQTPPFTQTSKKKRTAVERQEKVCGRKMLYTWINNPLFIGIRGSEHQHKQPSPDSGTI